jgi:hypothetical protein
MTSHTEGPLRDRISALQSKLRLSASAAYAPSWLQHLLTTAAVEIDSISDDTPEMRTRSLCVRVETLLEVLDLLRAAEAAA